jgi:hypothetical protein
MQKAKVMEKLTTVALLLLLLHETRCMQAVGLRALAPPGANSPSRVDLS